MSEVPVYYWKTMSGEERDLLIAREIIGWTNLHYEPAYVSPDRYTTAPGGWYGKGPEFEVFMTKKYSEDLPSALEVAERWAFNWQVGRDVGWCGDGEGDRIETRETFAYHLILSYPGMPMWGVDGRTLAEAIWLAELKRRGIRVIGPLEEVSE